MVTTKQKINKYKNTVFYTLFGLTRKGSLVDEKDTKIFLDDFRKSDTKKKLELWYYAIEQEALWEEILGEISAIAQAANPQKTRISEEE